MERRDIRQVTELLQKFLKRFQLAPSMTEEEVSHWFLPQDNIIDTYVVEVVDQPYGARPRVSRTLTQ